MSNSFCNEETLNPFIHVNKSKSKNVSMDHSWNQQKTNKDSTLTFDVILKEKTLCNLPTNQNEQKSNPVNGSK